MDSPVSPKDEIWFLRVCHHILTGLYHGICCVGWIQQPCRPRSLINTTVRRSHNVCGGRPPPLGWARRYLRLLKFQNVNWKVSDAMHMDIGIRTVIRSRRRGNNAWTHHEETFEESFVIEKRNCINGFYMFENKLLIWFAEPYVYSFSTPKIVLMYYLWFLPSGMISCRIPAILGVFRVFCAYLIAPVVRMWVTADTDVDRNLWKNFPLWPSILNRPAELGQLAASETLSNRVGMTMGRFVRGLLF